MFTSLKYVTSRSRGSGTVPSMVEAVFWVVNTEGGFVPEGRFVLKDISGKDISVTFTVDAVVGGS